MLACGEILRHQGMLRMSQSPSDSAGDTYRRKIWPKLIGFGVLFAVVWLQPKIHEWLDGRNLSRSADSGETTPSRSNASTDSQQSADRKAVVMCDAVRIDHDPGTVLTASDDPKNNATLSKTAPASGRLTELRNNVFESAAGLRYVPGSAENHRLRHVMQHAKDDDSKPIHGVFEGNRDQILAVIDEAYLKAEKGGRDVHRAEQNERLVYTVNLGRKIGYMGGSEGRRKNNPDCRYVRIVLEDGNVVISAYPTKSF